MLKDKNEKRNLIYKSNGKKYESTGLICTPHDHGNHEILKSSSIKKLNSQPI
jgi:hypothetical protein